MGEPTLSNASCTLEAKMDEIRALGEIECGKEAAKYFQFDDDYRNLNHGSFGTYPKVVRPILHHFQHLAEARPDEYIRWTYNHHLDISRCEAASFVKASPDNCVFVPNATTAVNTVLRNMTFKPGDVIIMLPTVYGACEKTIIYLTETTPVKAHKVSFRFPISDNAICSALGSAITSIRAAGQNPVVALFDTIASMPGVRLPFERLTALCRDQKVLSLIDGAHGIGHIPLNLNELDPDFFVSNCHKWLDVPRGCALLHVPERHHAMLRSTLPTSHGFVPLPDEDGNVVVNPLPTMGKSPFHLNFDFVGTLDTAPYVILPAALEWRRRLVWNGLKGEEAHGAYCRSLARRAGVIVSEALGTEVLSNASCEGQEGKDTLGDCFFAMVRLPLDVKEVCGTVGGGDGEERKVDPIAAGRLYLWMCETFVIEFKTSIQNALWDGDWWVRLSAQVYLTEEDFHWAGKVLKEVCERGRKGEWKAERAVGRL